MNASEVRKLWAYPNEFDFKTAQQPTKTSRLYPKSRLSESPSDEPRQATPRARPISRLVVQIKHLSPPEVLISRCKLLHTTIPSVRLGPLAASRILTRGGLSRISGRAVVTTVSEAVIALARVAWADGVAYGFVAIVPVIIAVVATVTGRAGWRPFLGHQNSAVALTRNQESSKFLTWNCNARGYPGRLTLRLGRPRCRKCGGSKNTHRRAGHQQKLAHDSIS